MLLPFQGERHSAIVPQGVALGYVLVGLSGRVDTGVSKIRSLNKVI